MSIAGLQEWFAEVGITTDPQLIRLHCTTLSGCEVRAASDVAEGAVLGSIPAPACLSVRTSTAAAVIEEERLGGGLGLVVAVMHELALGSKSHWHGYFNSLPSREYVPLFWTDAELTGLQGTEIQDCATSDRQHTEEDFTNDLLPVIQRHPHIFIQEAMTLAAFRTAASWVGSRAFGINRYHGMSMMPLADVFNHKAAKVQLSGDYALDPMCLAADSSDDSESGGEQPEDESDDDVDGHPSNGEQQANGSTAPISAADPASHQETSSDDGEGSERGEHEDSGEDDRGPSRKRARLTPGDLVPDSEQLRLDIGICVKGPEGSETIEIIAARPLQAGQEIFNTYGELGNAELVAKYGFALPDNPFDKLTLDKATLLELACDLLSKKALAQRCEFLERESDLLEEDEEPLDIYPHARLSPCLFTLLTVLFTPGKLFKGWSCIEDVIAWIQTRCMWGEGTGEQLTCKAASTIVCLHLCHVAEMVPQPAAKVIADLELPEQAAQLVYGCVHARQGSYSFDASTGAPPARLVGKREAAQAWWATYHLVSGEHQNLTQLRTALGH